MIPVEIKYKALWFIPVKYKRIMPAAWQECNKEQMRAIAALYQNTISDTRFISRFIGVPHFVVRRLDEYHIYCLIEQLVFMEDYTAHDSFFLDKIGEYKAPGVKMQGVSFGQFMFIDTYYGDYLTELKDEDLHKFMAALYTKNGFTQQAFEEGVNYFKGVSATDKFATIINYRLIMEWLMDRYKLVFGRKKETDKNRKPKKVQNAGWVKIFDNIVGDDIVNSDRYAEKPLHDVLRFLTKKIIENAKRP